MKTFGHRSNNKLYTVLLAHSQKQFSLNQFRGVIGTYRDLDGEQLIQNNF